MTGAQTVVQFFHKHDIETCEIEERSVTPFFQTKIHNGHVPTFQPGMKLKVNPPKGRIRTWDHSNYDRYRGHLYVHDVTYENVAFDGEEKDEFPRLTELLIKVTMGATPPMDDRVSKQTAAEYFDSLRPGNRDFRQRMTKYAKRDADVTVAMDDNYRKQSEAAARSGPGLFDAILKSAQAEFGAENVKLLDDEILVAGHRAIDLLRLKGFLKAHLKKSPLKDIPLTKEQATALADQFKKAYPELDDWKLRNSEKGPSGIYNAVLDYMEQLVEPDTNPHTRRQELEYQLVTLIEERGMVDGPAALAEKYGPYTLLAYLFTWEMEGMERSYGEVEQQNSEWAKRVVKAEEKRDEMIRFMQYRLQPTLTRLTKLLGGLDNEAIKDVQRQFAELAKETLSLCHSPHTVPEIPGLSEFYRKIKDYTDGMLFVTMREEAVKSVIALANSRIDESAQAHLRWVACGNEASLRLIGKGKLDNWLDDLYFGPHVNVEENIVEPHHYKAADTVWLFKFAPGWCLEVDNTTMTMAVVTPSDVDHPALDANMVGQMVSLVVGAYVDDEEVRNFFDGECPLSANLFPGDQTPGARRAVLALNVADEWQFDDATLQLLGQHAELVGDGETGRWTFFTK